MEADWEVEVGGGAPIIEAYWPGFVDLRYDREHLVRATQHPQPDRLGEISEAVAFRPLAVLLRTLNETGSPVWTSKCDLWEPSCAEFALLESVVASTDSSLACYLDLLPVNDMIFTNLEQAEILCREWVSRLAPIDVSKCRVDLVIRQAIVVETEGFGITAYLGAAGADRFAAANALSAALAAFATAIRIVQPPQTGDVKLQ